MKIIASIMLLATMLSPATSIYDFSFKAIDGIAVNISDFRGKSILIVKTASKCGFTKQYNYLQALHEQYCDDLVVISFPSDNFGGKELDNDVEIQNFCERKYGVTFLLTEKIDGKGDIC